VEESGDDGVDALLKVKMIKLCVIPIQQATFLRIAFSLFDLTKKNFEKTLL
jgi:hypothetical protein